MLMPDVVCARILRRLPTAGSAGSGRSCPGEGSPRLTTAARATSAASTSISTAGLITISSRPPTAGPASSRSLSVVACLDATRERSPPPATIGSSNAAAGACPLAAMRTTAASAIATAGGASTNMADAIAAIAMAQQMSDRTSNLRGGKRSRIRTAKTLVTMPGR